ncbi:unnamed protein product [Parascedosporium putredinis]|uniref:DUF908 domain-containing protein n=1 Tax=Parascedosporium putredinis TaxID=1442378 RepID=A0A9P1H8G7_9PEZI|nr:unnamed protein product [Parascedosporium putredinis]CAI7999360.1 unnamed protein product [Parascedosporium putredinis]
MQAKHKETQSPWLKAFVKSAVAVPLPLLPQALADFPSRWPFPRGDLFHWIPLLNRFDNILECFVATYNLEKGPQTQEFASDLLLNIPVDLEYAGDGGVWTTVTLKEAGFGPAGDEQLLEAVLSFTRMLLENCGNRSIYSSSAHLNHVLNTTSMPLLLAALRVGSELARRYQASLKRLGRNTPQQQVTAALLANHYNIDLDSVHQLAMPFVRTPIVSLADTFPATATPGSSSKGKERAQPTSHAKNAATMYANDLVAVASSDPSQWTSWGDVKIVYYPQSVGGAEECQPPGPQPYLCPEHPDPFEKELVHEHAVA